MCTEPFRNRPEVAKVTGPPWSPSSTLDEPLAGLARYRPLGGTAEITEVRAIDPNHPELAGDVVSAARVPATAPF